MPVVGANIGGIPELIENNRTGKLFPSGNSKELAQVIRVLWEAPEELNGYRENLKKLNRLDADEYARDLIDKYGE